MHIDKPKAWRILPEVGNLYQWELFQPPSPHFAKPVRGDSAGAGKMLYCAYQEWLQLFYQMRIIKMRRYSNFEKLKASKNAGLINAGMPVKTEAEIVRFINLLRGSVMNANNSFNQEVIIEANSNVKPYGRKGN